MYRPAYPSVFDCICMEIGQQQNTDKDFPKSMEIVSWTNMKKVF